MNKRFTNFPNIKANIDDLSRRYNPEWDVDPEHCPMRYETFMLLGIVAKLTHEVSMLEKRVYELENPLENWDINDKGVNPYGTLGQG